MRPSTNENVEGSVHNHFICWKSAIGGIFFAAIVYLVLSALGAGILGNSAQSAIEAEHGGVALMTGIGLWMAISALISVFAGSYFTSRISGYSTSTIGAAHGLIVASVFFVLAASGVSSAVFSGVQGIGKVTHVLAAGSSDLAANPEVQDLLQKTIGDAQMKSDAKDVMQGLSYRVVRGDFASAKIYLAYQTGLPEDQIDSKISQLQSQVTDIAKRMGEASATALAISGWTVFAILTAGLICAAFGGMAGNHANLNHPLVMTSERLGHLSPSTV